jgi:hypothetical protein
MRALKILAISYAIKTLLVGIAWLFVPDLPQRAATFVRRACGLVEPAPVTAPPAPPPAAPAPAQAAP